MSLNSPQQNPKRLHSPLLDGKFNKIADKNNVKGKRTYYNPLEENKLPNIIDETLDTTLFNNPKKEKPVLTSEFNLINQGLIDSLESSFKIANIFICASGGILSILEFINIIRTLNSGSFSFGNSLIVFGVAFIGTILASVICYSFIHLIRTIKYIYLNTEIQKIKIDKLLNQFNTK